MIDNIIRSGVVLKSRKAYKIKTRKHFIRKYELLARCIQTNLELFILH